MEGIILSAVSSVCYLYLLTNLTNVLTFQVRFVLSFVRRRMVPQWYSYSVSYGLEAGANIVTLVDIAWLPCHAIVYLLGVIF